MAQVELHFGFEQSLIPLGDEYFAPLDDAVECWSERTDSGYEIVGPTFRILYEHKDGSWILLRYGPCQSPFDPPYEERPAIWRADSPPTAAVISPDQALSFLLRGQCAIPPSLKGLKLPAAPPATLPRPWSHWAGKHYLAGSAVVASHQVDVLAELRSLVSLGISLVQVLRDGTSPLGDDAPHVVRAFCGALGRRYPIEHGHWWKPGLVPPAEAGLADLQWPGGTHAALVAVQSLLHELEGVAVAYAAQLPHRHPDGPTYVERQAAETAIRALAPEIEHQLEIIHRVLQERQAESQTAAAVESPKKAPVKMPTTKEFRLWWMRQHVHGTQGDIARLYQEQCGEPCHQGEVSRATRSVNAWTRAGNVMPALPSLGQMEAVASVDPKHIDRGRRKDGRTPRQRDSGKSD